MDFYLEFLRKLDRSSAPESTLQELVKRVKGAIEKAPTRLAMIEGSALLAALHDYANLQAIQALPAFREIKESVETLMAALDADLELDANLWGEEGSDDSHEDGPEDGLSKSRRFLDFEGLETWSMERWLSFVRDVDRVTDLATTSPSGLDSMAHFLTNLHSVFGKMSVETQKQALIVADRLILAFREKTEVMMSNMQDQHQMELMGNLDGWDDSPERACGGPPYEKEADAIPSSENHLGLDLSGWATWNEEDWAIFDQAVSDAQAAATASPADPEPAMQLFLGIRQNIETLALHRRFSMGNTADDLLETIKRGMAQDLFQIQKKCPYAPRPRPIDQNVGQPAPKPNISPTSDRGSGHWKKGRVGRELVELNFDHIADWGLSEWAGLKIEVDKLAAATELTAEILGPPGQMLEDIRVYIGQVPQHYQEEITQMAAKLERAISGRAAEALAEIQLTSG